MAVRLRRRKNRADATYLDLVRVKRREIQLPIETESLNMMATCISDDESSTIEMQRPT